jgi:hypothetical protein
MMDKSKIAYGLKPGRFPVTIIFISILLFTVSCSRVASTRTPSPPEYRAVYLVRDPGVLSGDDLQAHPEVLVVHSTEDFQSAAKSRIALWVDKNAIDLVQKRSEPWISQKPQRYYPVVLVGISDPQYAFPNLIPVAYPFVGPPAPGWPDEYQATPDPNSKGQGFSVWILLEDSETEKKAWGPGFEKPPTVQNILDITNPLLEGKVPSTPAASIP